MSFSTAKFVATVELLLASTLAIIAGAATRDIFVSAPQHGEWSPMIVSLAVPLAVSFLVAALALFRGWRSRWFLQIAPCATILAVSMFLWWADRVP